MCINLTAAGNEIRIDSLDAELSTGDNFVRIASKPMQSLLRVSTLKMS